MTYPNDLAPGALFTSVLTVGAKKESGKKSSKPCRIQILNGSWWTRLPYEHTNKQPVKKSTPEAEALGRSRGGFSTKLHVAVDALGNPLGFTLTPGQRSDFTQAEALVSPHDAEAVIGDKGYDSNKFITFIEAREAKAVIPCRKNRKEQREIDENLYKDRNKVERFIGRIKHYRRIGHAMTRRLEIICLLFISHQP